LIGRKSTIEEVRDASPEQEQAAGGNDDAGAGVGDGGRPPFARRRSVHYGLGCSRRKRWRFGGMKWLIWSPAIAIIFLAAAVPGGLILFGLPLLALGYLLISVIALGGRAEHRAAPRARAVRGRSEPASHYQRKEF
jgi:hypothetical protein